MKKIISFLFISCLFMGSMTHNSQYNNTLTQQQEEKYSRKQEIKNELAHEVNNYIKSVAPESQVSADYLVNGCADYNIDIIFVLAQGTLESHFATKGVGGKINSIFNVRVYDTIKNGNDVASKYRYPHPDESIEPYLQLLKENYLVDGKTETDLLSNFVNKYGQRYASYPTYETQMAHIMKRIKRTTKIDSLSIEYKAMDMIQL